MNGGEMAASSPPNSPRVAANPSTAAAGSITDSTFVEFGAGKGYLTALLSECTGVRRLVLMDHGAFKTKADRCFCSTHIPGCWSVGQTRRGLHITASNALSAGTCVTATWFACAAILATFTPTECLPFVTQQGGWQWESTSVEGRRISCYAAVCSTRWPATRVCPHLLLSNPVEMCCTVICPFTCAYPPRPYP
jgi:hypothetical protein